MFGSDFRPAVTTWTRLSFVYDVMDVMGYAGPPCMLDHRPSYLHQSISSHDSVDQSLDLWIAGADTAMR
jgi:hypothetical protein